MLTYLAFVLDDNASQFGREASIIEDITTTHKFFVVFAHLLTLDISAYYVFIKVLGDLKVDLGKLLVIQAL